MARQKIINVCPYNANNYYKCIDSKSKTRKGICIYMGFGKHQECNHSNPNILLQHNLTDEEVEDFINIY